MSLSICDVYPLSVVRTSRPRTLFSSSFLADAYGGIGLIPEFVPLVLEHPTAGTFRTRLLSLQADAGSVGGGPDIMLGLDWVDSVIQLMYRFGFTMEPGFDPFRAFLPYVAAEDATPGTLSVVEDASSVHPVTVDARASAEPCPPLSVFGHPRLPAHPPFPVSVAAEPFDRSHVDVPLPRVHVNAVASSSKIYVDSSFSVADGPRYRDGRDVISVVFLSPITGSNIFTNEFDDLVPLLTAHGVNAEFFTSAADCRDALLAHFFSGACVSPFLHEGCCSTREGFQSPVELAHFSLSTVISSPRVAASSLVICAGIFGFAVPQHSDDAACQLARTRLCAKRRALVADYSHEHPSDLILEQVEYLKLPALISLSSLHRITMYKPSLEGLRRRLTEHVATGQCAIKTNAAHSVACASVFDQTFPVYPPDTFTDDERREAMQINLLTYLMPRLTQPFLSTHLDHP
ncbi:hypothetical protein B0H11DRAFT_2231172 [Mycena galericulata]|nr:hypothetical protein B0H11DRAFT_2231172 [Mycena galericulata]